MSDTSTGVEKEASVPSETQVSSSEGGGGDGEATVTVTTSPSAMETKEPSAEDDKGQEETAKVVLDEMKEAEGGDAEFVVLEEDDGDEEETQTQEGKDDGLGSQSDKTDKDSSEEPEDKAETEEGKEKVENKQEKIEEGLIKVKEPILVDLEDEEDSETGEELKTEKGPEEGDGDAKTGSGGGAEEDEGKGNEDTVLLANPLFGKKVLPVVDISGESDSEEVDDVDKNGKEEEKSGCGCACLKDKKKLKREVIRLRKTVGELGKRNSVLEDFIQVEYAEKFESFVKSRERLLSLGFGGEDTDGKRNFAKQSELIGLLAVIKEQGSDQNQTGKGGQGATATSTQKLPADYSPSPPKKAKGVASSSTSSSPRKRAAEAEKRKVNANRERERDRKSKSSSSSDKKDTEGAADGEPEVQMISTQVRASSPTNRRLCPRCPLVLKRTGLRDHLRSAHCPELRCKLCVFKFSSKHKLKSHMKMRHRQSQGQVREYLEKMEKEVVEPWLDKMVKLGKVPTQAELDAYHSGSNQPQQQPQPKRWPDRDPRPGQDASHYGHARGGGIGRGGSSYDSGMAPVMPGPTVTIATTQFQYGPGGYGQYAANYLQNVSRSRLYTPF